MNMNAASPTVSIDNTQRLPSTTAEVPTWIDPKLLKLAEHICGVYVVPVVCLFGIACNALNLLVLTRRQMRGSPYTYLLGLAVTDVSVLTLSVVESALSKPLGQGVFFWQVYEAYIFLPIANIFSSSSVWITVLLTVERYISVRYPLKAKEVCTRRLARRTIVAIVLLAAAINLPRFFVSVIVENRTSPSVAKNSSTKTASMSNSTQTTDAFRLVVTMATAVTTQSNESGGYKAESTAFGSGKFFGAWTWFMIGAVHAVPCLTLLYLNAGLIIIVCRASRRRAALRAAVAKPPQTSSQGLSAQQSHHEQEFCNRRRGGGESFQPQERRSSTTAMARWWSSRCSSAQPIHEVDGSCRRQLPVRIGSVVVGDMNVSGNGNGQWQQHSQSHQHHSSEQIRMTITCISIICLFLVCIIPSAFSNKPVAKALFGRGQTMDQFTDGPFYRLLRVVTNMLVYCNLSMNFLLYCVFNHKFLRTLRSICHRWCWFFGVRDPSRPEATTSNRWPMPVRCCLFTNGHTGADHATAMSLQMVQAGRGSADRCRHDHGDIIINSDYSRRMSSTTSGGSAAGACKSSSGKPRSSDGSCSGDILVLEVEDGLPVVVSMQRRGRTGYEAVRSASVGGDASSSGYGRSSAVICPCPKTATYQFPLRERPISISGQKAKVRSQKIDRRVKYD